MTKITFENKPSTKTPINGTNLNKLNNVSVGITKPTLNEETWVQKSNNLFDKNVGIKTNYTYTSTGTITALNGAFVQEKYIPVDSSTKYTFFTTKDITSVADNRLVVCEYDSSYNFIKRNVVNNANSIVVTTSSTTKYVKLNGMSTALDNLQFQQGNATNFESYVEKKIYAVNENGSYEELINAEDTGWILADLTDKFETYASGFETMYRKQGKFVEIRGVVKPKEALSNGGNETSIFVLPVGFRPKRGLQFVCQGSASNRWLISVNPGGTVNISRYGTTSFIEVPVGAWLPFNVVYMLD